MACFNGVRNFADDSVKLECFRFFDKNSKEYLDEKDFNHMIRSLLNLNDDELNESFVKDLFVSFDCNCDQKIDAPEFEGVWENWIKPLVKPVTALLIIDVQNDFIDGSLALKNCPAKQDGNDVVPVINELISKIKFDVLVYSLDRHPEDHISFFENVKLYEISKENEKNVEDLKPFDTVLFKGPPKMEQKLWPKHCVSKTWGAELHPDLKVSENSILIYKGIHSNIDSYSAFWDNMKLSKTELYEQLKQKRVTHVFVCGLAFDYCVSFTALDASDLGFATVILKDASRGTDDNTMEMMEKELVSNSCVLATSSEVEHLVKGKDIRIQFARTLAKRCTVK